MRVYSHFAVNTLSNTYLAGLPSGEAILIDPGVFDVELLELIEHHSFTVSCVLLTHANADHLAGLRILRRVYDDLRICSAMPAILDYEVDRVRAGETLDVCGERMEVIGLPGQGRDCLAYLIGGFLFCGTALSAGEFGSVPNAYAKALMIANIEDAVLNLPNETVILPFYGPPSTVGAERVTLPMEESQDLEALT